MSDRDELVTRLRDDHNSIWQPIMDDAADQIERDGREIERLTAENVRLRDALSAIGAPGRGGFITMSDSAVRGWATAAAGSASDVLEDEAARAALNGEGET